MVELPTEASSPIISDVTSVPMAFRIRRAPPGCRFAKVETSKTAPSTITQERPFRICEGRAKIKLMHVYAVTMVAATKKTTRV